MSHLPARQRPRLGPLALLPALLLALAMVAPAFAAPPAQAGAAARPAHAEHPQLSATFSGTPGQIAPGETATLALELRNAGAEAANLLVSVVTARWLRYLPGTATPGASFDNARTVVWANVSLAANASRVFTIEVRAEAVRGATEATSVATVLQVGSGHALARAATITVRPAGSPEPQEAPNLRASLLFPSRAVVRAGQTVSYTLLLVNTGSAGAVVSASLVISEPLSYVAGSASDGGSYDAATQTLRWQGVEVPSGEARRLRFAALAGSVDQRTPVVLRALISAGEQRIERRAALLLVPGDDRDGGRPVVTGFVAGSSDVVSDPTITLNISATDDVSVTRMYVREWQLSTRPLPRWEPVRSSGWVPFQSSLPWTLGAANGAHVLGVWVQDAAGHVSALSDESVDVVNLVRPDATVARGGLVPYLVRYDAGADVQLSLETTSGDADLYVWYPRSFRLPDEISTNEGTAADNLRFAAPHSGYYLIGVYGSQSSSYNLSISPGGGAHLAGGAALLAEVPAGKEPPGLVSPLAQAGTSPLGSDSAGEPAAGATLFLPLVAN
jgi:uncharacterized repeat protein (TIGR01451 family)